MEDERLRATLMAVLMPNFTAKAFEWVKNCSSREAKGLKLIGAIYKYKGQKRFRSKLNTTTSDSFLSEVSRDISKRAMMSTYDSDFSSVECTRAKTAILTSSRFLELPCSRLLNPEASRYLRNWISLRDSDLYLDAILDSLRSLYAFCNYPGRSTTESRQQFVWKKPKPLMRCSSFVQKNREPPAAKPAVKHRPIDIRAASVCQLFTSEQMKQRREAVLRGSGQVATWLIAPKDMPTSYHSTYITPYNKYPLPPVPDFRTSIALVRMVPNPDWLRRDN